MISFLSIIFPHRYFFKEYRYQYRTRGRCETVPLPYKNVMKKEKTLGFILQQKEN